MKVAIDYRPALGTPTGIGRFVDGLVHGLAAIEDGPRIVLYAAMLGARRRRAAVFPVSSDRVRACAPRVSGKLLEIASRVLPIGAETFTGRVDVFHLTDYVYPPVRSSRVLFTLHDVAFEIEPQWYRRDVVELLRRRVASRLRRGDAVLTVSQSSRRDIVARYGLAPDRVHVALPGVDPGRFRPRAPREIERVLRSLGVDGPYYLAVGTLQPRKNLATLIDAFEMARERGGAKRLVVCGPVGWKCAAELERIRALERRGLARHLGYLPDRELPALYTGASAFCFPSHYEGFGLPVLEAMAAGSPVISSTAPALVEVGADATMQVEGTSVDALAEAMVEVARDPTLRRRLVARGRRRAADFSWDRCARAVLHVYRSLVG